MFVFEKARDGARQAETGLAPCGLFDSVDRVCAIAERNDEEAKLFRAMCVYFLTGAEPLPGFMEGAKTVDECRAAAIKMRDKFFGGVT